MKKRIAFGMALTMMFLFLLNVTALNADERDPPAQAEQPQTGIGIQALETSLLRQIHATVPEIVNSVAIVIGVIAPSVLQLVAMVVLVGLVIGVYRRLLGR